MHSRRKKAEVEHAVVISRVNVAYCGARRTGQLLVVRTVTVAKMSYSWIHMASRAVPHLANAHCDSTCDKGNSASYGCLRGQECKG